jgi:hypothetical protein
MSDIPLHLPVLSKVHSNLNSSFICTNSDADRVLRTAFSGRVVRLIDAQAGLTILRAEPELCDQRTILTLAGKYSCLTLYPAPGSNRDIFRDRIAELAKDVSQGMFNPGGLFGVR